jgi:protein-S-isoprenylcysteine O-methyltransferase Ste14
MAQPNGSEAVPVSSPRRDLKITYMEWARHHRRTVAIPLVVIVLLFARFDKTYFIYSYVLIVAGEALRIWAAGHLQKEKILTTGGPYRLIRNPLYLGSFMISIGFYLVMIPRWLLLVILAYFAMFYYPVIRYEERLLHKKFPSQYSLYAKTIPAFFPTLREWPSPTTHFSFQQMIKNKEYNAVLGILLAYSYLILLRR